MKSAAAIVIIFAVFLFATPKLWASSDFGIGQPETAAVGSANNIANSVYHLLRVTGGGSEIVTLSVLDYITGCLFAQMPPDYESEALKAQAAVIHTYAERLIRNNSLNSATGDDVNIPGVDFSDDPSTSQAYFSEREARDFYGEQYDEFYPKIRLAADYGARTLITYEDKPIYAVYTAVTNGVTNTGGDIWGKDFPYLTSVSSVWDEEYVNFTSVNELTADKLRLALLNYNRGINMPVDYALWFGEATKNAEGYVSGIQVGDMTISGGDAWRIFGLRSTDFGVSYDGTGFVFQARGVGHGAGLSQFGANYLASNGFSAQEIIKYYYTGVTVN